MCVIFIYEFFRPSLFNSILFWFFGYHGILQNIIEKESDCSLPCLIIEQKIVSHILYPQHNFIVYIYLELFILFYAYECLPVCMHVYHMCLMHIESLKRLSETGSENRS